MDIRPATMDEKTHSKEKLADLRRADQIRAEKAEVRRRRRRTSLGS